MNAKLETALTNFLVSATALLLSGASPAGTPEVAQNATGEPAGTNSLGFDDPPAQAATSRPQPEPAKGRGKGKAADKAPPVDDDFLSDKPAAAEKAKELKIEDVRASLVALQTATDATTARRVLKDHGDVESLALLKPDKFGAVIEAAKAKLPV